MSGLGEAVGFLTVAGGSRTPSPRALAWFGFVGALVGATVGGVHWVGVQLTTPLLAAIVAVGADLALTGLLHIDGLADSADGLLPPLDRARRLVVMKDPAVGAFGLVVTSMVLMARVGSLAAAPVAPLTIAGIWALSRVVMAATVITSPYARPEGGLATAFAGHGNGAVGEARRVAVALGVSAAGAMALAVLGRGLIGAVCAIGAIVGSLAVVLFARHRIGGYTGDVLGACGVVGETAALLLLAVR